MRRDVRNLAIAGLGALSMAVAEAPVIQPLLELVERRRWGLLRRVELPLWMEVPAALLLMDYTFYVWHILMHRVPLLWRFHLVHHVDLDLDASTALRFHFGEVLVSIPWRAAQAAGIGLTRFTFSVWQLSFALCILFHHSNLRMPFRWERRLNRLLVTPRMHGIHHSLLPDETNSNWSSGLTLWDRLHGTLRLNVPQEAIDIGIPAFQDPATVTLPKLITTPFEEQRDEWVLPDGRRPAPDRVAAPLDRLLP